VLDEELDGEFKVEPSEDLAIGLQYIKIWPVNWKRTYIGLGFDSNFFKRGFISVCSDVMLSEEEKYLYKSTLDNAGLWYHVNEHHPFYFYFLGFDEMKIGSENWDSTTILSMADMELAKTYSDAIIKFYLELSNIEKLPWLQ
jgi:hypothetical protein